MPAQTGRKGAQVAKPTPRKGGSSNDDAVRAAQRGRLGDAPSAIIGELRKVVWPTWPELVRMTGVVIVTVLLFSCLVGGFDYLLSLGVGRIYNTPSSALTDHLLAVTTAVSR